MKQNVKILSIYALGFILLNLAMVVYVVINPDIINDNEAITQISITANTVFYLTVFFVLAFVFRTYLKNQVMDFLKRWKKTVPVVILGVVGIYTMVILIGILFTVLGVEGQADNQEQIMQMLDAASPLQLTLLLAFITFLAPVVEEIVFRKGVYGIIGHLSMKFIRQKDITDSVQKAHNIASVIAIVLSSFLFGAIHALDVYIFLYAGLGMALGVIYYISNKNVLTSILVHIIYNSISIIITFAMM